MRVRATSSALLLVASLVLLVGGCDSDDPKQATKEEPDQAADVRFSGERIEGTIFFQAGKRDTDMDLYRVRGTLNNTKQLTRGGRISIMGGGGDVLAAANARGSGGDRLEQLNPASASPLPGRIIDASGQAPSVSPDGKIIYTVQQYKKDGGDAGATLYVAGRPGARRNLVYRARPGEQIDGAWGPEGKPTVLFRDKPTVLVLEGPSRERRLDLGIKVFGLDLSSQGDVLARGDGRVVILTREGQRRTFKSSWSPLAWSPDGRTILAIREHQLGLLSPKDGSVDPIGSVRGGRVNYAAWLANESGGES